MRLGGEEFTRALMRHVATLRPEISSSDAADRDLRSSRSNCERAKVRLTSVDETSVYDAVSGLEFTVTRKEFNAVCSELFDRCISVVGGVLSDANCDVGDIDRVVLIGGATRMPELKARLAAKFGAEVCCHCPATPSLNLTIRTEFAETLQRRASRRSRCPRSCYTSGAPVRGRPGVGT